MYRMSFAIILFITSISFGQITISTENAPVEGMQRWTNATGSVSFNAASGSEDVTWNFTPFSFTQYPTVEFVNPENTGYQAEFPASTIAGTSSTGIFFMRVAASGMWQLGFVNYFEGDTIVIPYVSEVLTIPFPCTFGTSWSTVLQFTDVVTPELIYVYLDSAQITVNGWGTLVTPDWTRQALRCFYHTHERTYLNGTLIDSAETYRYQWWTQDPYRLASFSPITQGDSSFTFGYLSYSDGLISAADPVRGPVAENFKLSQNYPNPFNPNTNLPIELAKSAKVELTIYNEVGQVVSQMSYDLSAGQHNLPIDGSAWSTGNYFANVKAGNEAQTTRMLLVK